MRRGKTLVVLSWLLAGSALGQIAPPPRGHWVVDATNRVAAATIRQLDALAAGLDASGAGQLGVLVVETTNGVAPRSYATRVFNEWGIGHGGINDGLMLFIALKDRKSEIVLGSNCKVTSSQTDVVTRDDVVANFKRGQVDEGLLAAANSLVSLAQQASSRAPVTTPAQPSQVDATLMAYVRHEATFAEHSPRSWVIDPSNQLNASSRAQLDVAASDVYAESKGRVFFLIVKSTARYPELPKLADALASQVGALSKLPLAIIAWDEREGRLFLKLPSAVWPTAWEAEHIAKLQETLATQIMTNRTAGFVKAGKAVSELLVHGVPPKPMGVVLSQGFAANQVPIFGGLGATLLGGLVFGRRWNRRRSRSCDTCHAPRELLSEAEEDAHLSSGAQVEESIGSVEYDVWWCGRCNDALVLDYSKWFSSYGRCPKCNSKTKSSSSTTLVSATEYCEGEVRVDEDCANCDYRNRLHPLHLAPVEFVEFRLVVIVIVVELV